MKTKISVIVPVYNTSIYLETCLNSLLNQSTKDIEIICIDDGSTDNSLEILETFAKKDSRIKVLSQENLGQSEARNVGMEIAKGEYIGFVDSDDWVHTEMFEKMYENACRYDSDISMCSVTMHNDITGEERIDDPYMTLDLFPSEFENRVFNFRETLGFIFRICVVPWNKIYKREFLTANALNFVENLNYEDNVFFIDAYTSSEKVSLIKEPLYYYRFTSKTSLVRSDAKRDLKKLDFFKVFELEEAILKKKNLYTELKDYFEKSKINTLNYWYNKLEDKDTKEIYLKKLSKIAKI